MWTILVNYPDGLTHVARDRAEIAVFFHRIDAYTWGWKTFGHRVSWWIERYEPTAQQDGVRYAPMHL